VITLFTFGPMFGLPDPSPFVTKGLVLMKMSGLPFTVDTAGFTKAPKGKLPYINDGNTIVADTSFIRFHLEDKHGIDLDCGLSPEQRGIGWAVEKMCEDHLYWAIVDSRWMVKNNFDKGPRRYFDPAPAIIRPLVISKTLRDVKRTLHGQGFGRHSRAEIERLAACDIDAISAILGNRPFLFGDEPHGADASVFAFVAAVLNPYFDTPILAAARKHENLKAYRDRGMKIWFPELAH
jgi:glutathione S-transferase